VATWKKYFRAVNNPLDAAYERQQQGTPGDGRSTASKFQSILPEIYAGHPNRIQRYYQYEDMARDSDISAALDTIANFCTQSEEQSDSPFEVNYFQKATDQEIKIIEETLTQWVKANKFKAKLRKIFRNCAQNGDAFFIRDPEDHTWFWIDHYAVELVKMTVDGKREPEEYLIKNFDPNTTERWGTFVDDISRYRNPGMSPSASGRPMASQSGSQFQMAGADRDQRAQRGQPGQAGLNTYVAVKAENVVHLALSEDMDINAPFGQSVLDPIFKTFKQKELLEDSIIIYRVQRAPERRVFYIDVGAMNGVRAQSYIEGIKNEIHQRRIPNRTGGGSAIMDTAYNPLSMLDDYFFAQSSEGRGSKVEVLPSGDALGEITDLSYFTKKMARGLQIPTTYLSLGDDEQQASYNDGKLGSALIQEFKFSKYCMHLQSLLAPEFDKFFKEYLEAKGAIISPDLFELQFKPPQNFTKYRQIELDLQQTQVYSSVAGNTHLSERFKLRRFLNLTPEEMLENETDWAEENPEKMKAATGSTAAESTPDGDLGSIGMRPDDGGDLDLDLPDEGGDMDLGGDDLGGGGGDAPAPGGDAPAAPAPPAAGA
jgi:hypothetical protein